MTESQRNAENQFFCDICGQMIREEESESFDGLCEECWNDQLDEEFLEES